MGHEPHVCGALGDPLDLITSELSIGGLPYDVDVNVGDNGGVTLSDASSGTDRLSITNTSRGYWLGSPLPMPSEFFTRYLTLTWHGSTGDFIDLTQAFEPLDLIPLMTALMPTGFYNELTFQCADGNCASTGYTQTNFLINSLTAHSPSVPEPGTLALFAVGLLGGAVGRRSAVKAR